MTFLYNQPLVHCRCMLQYVICGNHSVSDMKILALCPSSGSNDQYYSRIRQEMHLISHHGTIHPHGINERFSYI